MNWLDDAPPQQSHKANWIDFSAAQEGSGERTRASLLYNGSSRAGFAVFVRQQLGMPEDMPHAEYEAELDRRIEESRPEPLGNTGNCGRRAKYWHRGIPISFVLTPTQANTVRLKVRKGEALADAMEWAEAFYGPFDWDGAQERYDKNQKEAGQ